MMLLPILLSYSFVLAVVVIIFLMINRGLNLYKERNRIFREYVEIKRNGANRENN